MEYCCIKKNLSQNFRILIGLAITLVPSKLLRNKIKKENRLINISNILLNFKLLIRHSQAKSDRNLISQIYPGLTITTYSTATNAVLRSFILSILGNYKSNITKVLE